MYHLSHLPDNIERGVPLSYVTGFSFFVANACFISAEIMAVSLLFSHQSDSNTIALSSFFLIGGILSMCFNVGVEAMVRPQDNHAYPPAP